MHKYKKTKRNNKKRRNCTYKKIKGGVFGRRLAQHLTQHATHHFIRPLTTETKKIQTGIRRFEPFAEKYIKKASEEYTPYINKTISSLQESKENIIKNIPKKLIKSGIGSVLSPSGHYIGEFAGPNIEEIMSQSQEPIVEKLSREF